MRSDELVLLGTEIKRRVLSGRFAFVLAVMAFFAWGITGQMNAFGAVTHVGYNAWDVILGVFGNTASILTSTVVFPLLLVFLLGSSVQEDVISGYSLVVQARLSRKNAYWWIKVIAILAVVTVTIAALYVISLLLGAVRGFSVFPIALSAAGGHPDAWNIARGVPPIYYSLPEGANVAVQGLLAVSYFIFAYFAVVMFVVGLTGRSKTLYTPLAFGAIVVASQLAVEYAASGFLRNFNLVTALTESAHRKLPAVDQPMVDVVPWSHSIMLLLGFLAVGLIAGAFLTPTRVKKARGKTARGLGRTPATAAISILLLLSATLLSGCNSMLPKGVGYEQFLGNTVPQVPHVKLGELSAQDLDYLKVVARQTVRLSDAVSELQSLFTAKNFHSSDEEIRRLLKQRLSKIDRELTDIKALKAPPALADWYRLQYEPGLDELQYVVDHLGPLYDKRDHVAVRMCLKHVAIAGDYFSAAGQTIAPFAPAAEKGAEAVRKGGNKERY
ncbi:MAG: hypothetical protein IBX64_10715 [Actinobacteria bacterium]|nr:hypothetical protein [Actinomycetota bacterium]